MVRHRLLLACLAMLAGCVPTFRSLRETAQLGERQGDLAAVLAHGPRYCALQEAGFRAAFGAGPQEGQPGSCASLEVGASARTMLRAAHLVGTYAASLGQLAQHRDVTLGTLSDFLGNTLATASSTASSLSVASAGNKLSGVMSLLSADWRRRELRRYVLDAKPPLQVMVERLQQHVRLSRSVLRGLKGAAPDAAGAQGERGLLPELQRELLDMLGHLHCPDGDTPCRSLRRFAQVWSMSLADIQVWIEDEDEALARYDQALSDFWAAYQVLYRHVADPADPVINDGAMYDEIRNELHRAASARLKKE